MKTDKRKARLQTIRDSVASKLALVNKIHDDADKRDEIETALERDSIIALHKEIELLESEGQGLREMLDFDARRNGSSEEVPFEGSRDTDQSENGGGSIGRAFTESPLLREWQKGPDGQRRILSGQSPWETPQVRIGSFMTDYLARDLVNATGDTVGGAFVPIDRKPDVGMGYQKEITIFDLLTMGSTGSDNVEFMRITGVTNNAAGTAEASATGDGSGAAPESAMAFSRVQEAVKDVVHWIPVTNNLLNDAQQVRTEIDSFLTYGVRQKAQDLVLNGNGGENFTGIYNTSGTTTQAWDTDILKTTRKARTKVRITGRHAPTAYVLNPLDWETIDLTQDGQDRYFFGGPAAMGQKRLWGLPVVECEDNTQGFGLCAAWNQAVLWDRMASAIFASNSHSDFFTRRITALLGVYRAAFGVKWPAAFVEMDLTA
jgi:HK97 family phage major capsid protein